MRFKVGDVVEIINTTNPFNGHLLGMGAVVLGYHEDQTVPAVYISITAKSLFDEPTNLIKESHLRLKRPPQETTTWRAVQEACGWSPVKTKETV